MMETDGANKAESRLQLLTQPPLISADRPFTESETTFLRYIRQWGKKVVFIVNKVDILDTNEEVQEVTQFVGNNATRLLGVDRTQVLAISARRALQAKLAIERSGMAGRLYSLIFSFAFLLSVLQQFLFALAPCTEHACLSRWSTIFSILFGKLATLMEKVFQ